MGGGTRLALLSPRLYRDPPLRRTPPHKVNDRVTNRT